MANPPDKPGKPPKIAATRPHVVEPTERKVYDQWAINGINTAGTGLAQDTARGSVSVIKYRDVPADGGTTEELAPPESGDRIELGDVYALAQQYPDLKTALDAFHAAVQQIMADRGQI